MYKRLLFQSKLRSLRLHGLKRLSEQRREQIEKRGRNLYY
jgi:hypothetical protein